MTSRTSIPAAEASASAQLGETEAASAKGHPAAPCAPDDALKNDVSVAEATPAASPARPPEASAVKTWGPAPPSTMEAYLDRWTHFFATDPGWNQTFSVLKAQGGPAPDPLAHHTFCRRLAAALAPMFVEPHGAPTIRSWGPAPPSTAVAYLFTWLQHMASVRAPKDTESSSPPQSGASPIEEQVSAIPLPPPLAPAPSAPSPLSAPPPVEPSTLPPTVLPPSVPPSQPAAPPAPATSAAPPVPASPTTSCVSPLVSPLPTVPQAVPHAEMIAARTPAPSSRAPEKLAEAVLTRDTRASNPTPHLLATRRLLSTTEAAAYCGLKTTGALRKARLEGRVVAAGRRGGAGTWMWDVADSRALLAR